MSKADKAIRFTLLFLFLFLAFIISLDVYNKYNTYIFLIEAVLLALIYLAQGLCRFFAVSKIKKSAESSFDSSLSHTSIIKYIFSFFPKHLCLTKDNDGSTLVIIFVRRKYAKYHFASKNHIEVYTGNRETYRTGKTRYSIGKNANWKLRESFRIKCNEQKIITFVFTKMPMDVTSSDKNAPRLLVSGDLLYDDCIVYSQSDLINSGKLRNLIKKTAKQRFEHFDLCNLKIHETNINLYVSRKKATKATHIHCAESGDILWEQFYLFGGISRPAREKKYVLKPAYDKNAITLVIIRGVPGNITRLDNGIFKSHLTAPEKNAIYLMTEKNALNFLKLI